MERCRLSDDPAVRPEWEIAGKMAEGRSLLGSAAVEGKVYMIAGCLSEQFSSTEVWDPDTGTFQYVAKVGG